MSAARLVDRRHAIVRTFAWTLEASLAMSFAGCQCPPTPPQPCEPSSDDPPVGWGPSILAPVFYGHADYGPDVGAPAHLRVYYPSLDGAPRCAPFLSGPGHFPLVVFLHGECQDESFHYTRWSRLPAVLARCGFVVAVPDLGNMGAPWDLTNATYSLIRSVITWMRSSWSRRQVLMAPPVLGIVGHSWGALHGAHLAVTVPATAYVSLGGVWTEWSPTTSWPILTLGAPHLLIWGSNDSNAQIPDPNWNALPQPRYRVLLPGGEHWDYLPSDATTCDSAVGPCDLVDELAADLTATFLSKYMPPEHSGILPGYIPPSLQVPTATLTTQQQAFAANHLASFRDLHTRVGCQAILQWETPEGSGSRPM